jgi:hypothetical protein
MSKRNNSSISKLCSRCKTELPIEAFGKHARCKDGLQPYCRSCFNEYKRCWRAKNPELCKQSKQRDQQKHHDRYIAYNRAYFAKHRDACNEGRRQRRLANIEAERAQVREWGRLNAEQKREINRKHYAANKHLYHASYQRRYAAHREEYLDRALLRHKRQRQAMPAWVDKEAILAIYREARRLSKSSMKYHVDHIVPINAKGVCGLHVP